MTIIQAILLGIVQGVTEFLPISSSGHLVISQHLLGLNESQITFDVFLHVASLLAILIFFFPKLIKISKSQIIAIVIGTVPAVVFGLLFKDYIESLFSSIKFVSVTLIITGSINFISEYLLKKPSIETKSENTDTSKVSDITWKSALTVGVFQALAIIPGISRSGSTLMGGLSQKMDRQSAFDFAFFLAIPAILGAGVLQVLDIFFEGNAVHIDWSVFLAGGLAAFVSGFVSLSFFNYILKSAKLQWFGWYCLLAGVTTFFLF